MGNNVHFFRKSSGGGGDAFIATFRTTTANESITLPYQSSGTYSGTIDWGDGTVVANSYANRTHTYAVSGDYDVTVLGECFGWTFRYSSDKTQIINIKNWGNGFETLDFGRSFQDCVNLDITATDAWKPITTTNIAFIFNSCTSLVYNDSVSLIDTSGIVFMTGAFRDATSFNQDISAWDFSGLFNGVSLSQFMTGKSSTDYDSTYYDNLLIKWASSPSLGGLQPNIIGTIDMGSIKYTANGASARASILANNKAQTINDGGQI